jgi:hypothetical protein
MGKNKRYHIPKDTQVMLRFLAGGRCEKRGCNKYLLESVSAPDKYNGSEIAHIIASSPNGNRGDEEASKDKITDISNLMYLCPACHNEIDKDENEEHFTVELLKEMKREHEERIRTLTSLTTNLDSHVIEYFSKISDSANIFSENRIKETILPDYYTSHEFLRLGSKNSFLKDCNPKYWELELVNLEGNFNQKVKPLIEQGIVERFLVFAIAPIPMLIKLGTLLDDKVTSIVYQKHRKPDTWKWQEEKSEDFEYIVKYPEKKNDMIALNVSLSGEITKDRIFNFFGNNDIDICTITIEDPNIDYLQTKEQLDDFISEYTRILDKLKSVYGQNKELHIFPACPISVAVEMGRRWMKKADMSLIIYDWNKNDKKFVKALEIDGSY